MNTQLKKIFLFILFISITPIIVIAQTAKNQPIVKVSGEVLTPFDITASSLKDYKQTTVIRKDGDGKDHTYQGVEVYELLKKAGVTLGKDLRGENLTKYLLAEASDGYHVIFALAELDGSFADRKIIVTTNVDGHPLPANEGPFRIIVADEKMPARCIRQLTSLMVKFAN
jgi:hypothetical protein